MATATSGIVVEFMTDAQEAALEIEVDPEPRGTTAQIELADGGPSDDPHDGIAADVEGHHLRPIMPPTQPVELIVDLNDGLHAPALPGMTGLRHVRIWLPILRGCRIKNVCCDGSIVEPVPGRPQFLVLGDSISQGFLNGDPGQTWPARVAVTHELDLVNQGVGGVVFQPTALTGLPGKVDPAVIWIAIGTNYRFGRCSVTEVERDVRGYLDTVARAWPDARTFVATPTIHDEDAYPTHPKSCYAKVPRIIEQQVARFPHMQLVDGRLLLEDRRRYYADADHPSMRGARLMALRIGRVIDGEPPIDTHEARAKRIAERESKTLKPRRESLHQEAMDMDNELEDAMALDGDGLLPPEDMDPIDLASLGNDPSESIMPISPTATAAESEFADVEEQPDALVEAEDELLDEAAAEDGGEPVTAEGLDKPIAEAGCEASSAIEAEAQVAAGDAVVDVEVAVAGAGDGPTVDVEVEVEEGAGAAVEAVAVTVPDEAEPETAAEQAAEPEAAPAAGASPDTEPEAAADPETAAATQSDAPAAPEQLSFDLFALAMEADSEPAPRSKPTARPGRKSSSVDFVRERGVRAATPRAIAALLDRLHQGTFLDVPLEQMIVRQLGEVLFAAPDFAALELPSGELVLWGDDADLAMEVLAKRPRPRTITFLNPALVDAVGAAYLGVGEPSLHCPCVYTMTAPVKMRTDLSVSPLGEEHLDLVLDRYAHPEFVGREAMGERLRRGDVLGGRLPGTGEIVGFIGVHDDGSMGMLEVFPEHRRRGYAHDLEGALINRQLEQGLVPWGQVFPNNEASLALQRKIGLEVGPACNGHIDCMPWENDR